MTMPKFEPVAWLRDTLDGGLSTMTDCCTNVVKEIWLKANPKNVERYTAPLYTLDQLTKAYEAGKRDAIPEADRLSDENDQLRAQINKLREALEKHVTELMNIAVSNGANSVSMPDDYVATALLLSETTEQSLAKYRNKVIEECAVIAENCEPDEHGRLSVQDIAEALRTIKEQP